MTEEEMRDHAARLLGEHQQNLEYSLVYEDDELQDESEETQLAIHGLMNSAQIFVTWSDSDSEYQVAGESSGE